MGMTDEENPGAVYGGIFVGTSRVWLSSVRLALRDDDDLDRRVKQKTTRPTTRPITMNPPTRPPAIAATLIPLVVDPLVGPGRVVLVVRVLVAKNCCQRAPRTRKGTQPLV